MTTVLDKLKPKFVVYHRSSQEEHVELVIVANSTSHTVTFSLSILRQSGKKEYLYTRYRLQPRCTLQFYTRPESLNQPIVLAKGDRIKAKASKKNALTITIIGNQK